MSSDWISLNSRFYRRVLLYESLQWNVDISQYRVAAAPNGGPIAVVRDPHALVQFRGAMADNSNSSIRIFNCAGVEISSFPWPDSFPAILNFAFTNNERLAILTSEAELFVYSLFGERLESFSLPEQCKSTGIADSHFHCNSLAIRLAGSNQLFCIPDINQPTTIPLPAPQLGDKPPTAMAVAFNHQSNSIEVFLSSASGTLILVDHHSATDLQLTNGPFACLAVNPAADKLAAFSDDGTLFVMPMDFQSNWSKFSTNSKLPPLSLVWCGNECVALYWEKMVLLVGLEGEFVKFSFDSALHLIPEFDGLRVLSSSQHELFEPVSEHTEAIFKVDSSSPAAKLFDAFESYERQSANSNEILRSVSDASADGADNSDALNSAISSHLAAASNEFHVEIQRQLLKSASYGKLFCPNFNADEFVETCRILRVLNQIRSANVGIPLTIAQYRRLEADSLIDRLTGRRDHLLASRICEYLNLGASGQKVLVDWACCKIARTNENQLADEELAGLIIDKLRFSPGVSFASIARVAFRSGRRVLACQLLEFEQSAAEQIPLLLSMREDELALDKAISSGDSDLVYLCLLQTQKSRPLKEFYSLIVNRPVARSLFQSFARQTDLAALKKFYYHLAMPVEAAHIAVAESFGCENLKDRVESMQIALEFYEKDKNNNPANVRALEEELKLLHLEAEFQQELNPQPPLIDLTLVELLEYFIVRGDSKRAQKVKGQFKLDDKRMWQIEVRALANAGMWSELWNLVAQNKKAPPIGYLPIIEACVENGRSNEAIRYIDKLPDYREAMEWACNLGYWKEAAEIAARNKDIEAIQLIRENCRIPNLLPAIEKILQAAATQTK